MSTIFRNDVEAILEIYSLSDILDFNEVTEEEALYMLLDAGLSLPPVKPINLET